MADRFYINDLQIEEPVGFDDLEFSMKRDDVFHGFQFEASTGTLSFYGVAADYLITQKETYGLKANVTFSAVLDCGTPDEATLSGRLNFGKYNKKCGTTCLVTLPVEETSCAVIFASRFDQRVDIDATTAFDKQTLLPAYTNLGQEIEIPAKTLLLEDEARLALQVTEELTDSPDWHTTISPDTIIAMLFPALDNVVSSSLGTFTPSSFPQLVAGGPTVSTPPTLDATVLNGNITCELSETFLEYRVKGHVEVTGTNTLAAFGIQLHRNRGGVVTEIYHWVNPISPSPPGTTSTSFVLLNNPTGWNDAGATPTRDFDISETVPITDFQQGDIYYFFVRVSSSTFFEIDNLTWTQHPESYLKITSKAICESSMAKSYLIHETLSRVTEAVTNRCMRVKSEYYGRVDSEPFAFNTDGCGGLRMLTSGLKIRRAPEDKFFASPKDLLEGLNGIDNIGFGIEADPDFPGQFILRVEPVEYFYQDNEMLIMDAIPAGDEIVQEGMHYSKIQLGYPNWQVQQVNGLGELQSTREYRTGLETISNTKDIQSQLVTGSYPIEITRQQSFASTGAADTTYDNNIFLLCLLRGMYGFTVEQGGIDNADNIFDPDTLMNFRLTPVRNLMRWYKSLINSYANINDTDSKLFFSSGTGNLTAEGEIIEGTYDALCKLESMTISESQDLFLTHFERQEDAKPLWKNETINFPYYMSLAQYQGLRAAPYGYISFSCGNGPMDKGFIKEIKFKPKKGTCTVNLIKKWE